MFYFMGCVYTLQFAEMWYPEQYAVWQKFKADQKASMFIVGGGHGFIITREGQCRRGRGGRA